MSYAHLWRQQNFSFPSGTVVLLLGYALLQDWSKKPAFGTKEISKAEYVATPTAYLVHPDSHPQSRPKVPGAKEVPDALGELQHKAHGAAAHH